MNPLTIPTPLFRRALTRVAVVAVAAIALLGANATHAPLANADDAPPTCTDVGAIIPDAPSSTWTLASDCIARAVIVVPNGFTFDGAGHTITAINTTTNAFGPVIRNGGVQMNVTNLNLDAQIAAGTRLSGTRQDRLAGILFHNGGGNVTDTTVSNVRRSGDLLGQEGYGVHVLATVGTSPPVVLDGLTVNGYQKSAVMAWGLVDLTLKNSSLSAFVLLTVSGRNPSRLRRIRFFSSTLNF